MTQFERSGQRTNLAVVAGIALAASLIGGVVGAALGPRAISLTQPAAQTGVQAGVQPAAVPAAVPAQVTEAARALRLKAAMDSAIKWEHERRQQSVNGSTALDQKWIDYGLAWEARERQMSGSYPTR